MVAGRLRAAWRARGSGGSAGQSALPQSDPDRDEGAWIFVSHSLRDWQTVREIRDLLEEEGHRPLLFFLRCLNDESEIHGLIRREIEARNFYLICMSENARRSRWVQTEIEIIKSQNNKVHEFVDVEEDWEAQVRRVRALLRRATVFISCSHRDEGVGRQIESELVRNDFRVHNLRLDGIQPGADWGSPIVAAIDESAKRGFVLLLLSPDSVESPFVQAETSLALERATKSGGNIIPIIVRDARETRGRLTISPIGQLLNRIQFVDISTGDMQNNIRRLIELLKDKGR